ncbi:MAG TPA: hypothetical protein VJT85_09290 [Gemmatimonadaceae bacterium]|nr:hypothetical protein [Gemmatimonadaceae bacterium]
MRVPGLDVAEDVVRQQSRRQLGRHVDGVAREGRAAVPIVRAVFGDFVQCSRPIHPSIPDGCSTSYTHRIGEWFTSFLTENCQVAWQIVGLSNDGTRILKGDQI